MPKTPNKKQIFLDVDGVLLDFHTNFSLYLKEKHSIELSSAVENYHTNSVLKKGEKDAKQLKLEKFFQQKNVMEDFFVSDYFSTLNALIDIHSYNQIAQKYPTYLLTNLSEKRKLAREKNLKLHGFSYQKIFFAGFDKYGDPNYPLKSKIILQKMEKNSEIIFLDDLTSKLKNEVLDAIPKAILVFLLTKPSCLRFACKPRCSSSFRNLKKNFEFFSIFCRIILDFKG